jgi:hypothetical protein
MQELVLIDKDASGHVSKRSMMGVRYVPLTPPTEMADGWVMGSGDEGGARGAPPWT